jgi:hypothetical protein
VKIIVHPAASAELNNAAAFYSAQANKQLGLALISEFEKAASLLSGNPELGTTMGCWHTPLNYAPIPI